MSAEPGTADRGVTVSVPIPAPAPESAGTDHEAERLRFQRACFLPAVAVMGLIIGLPALQLLLTSLTPLDLTRPDTLADFSKPWAQFAQLTQDARFLNSLWVQAKLSAGSVAVQLLLGVALALLLHGESRALRGLRTVFIIPMVLPPIVVAVIWKVLYTPTISPLHHGLSLLGWEIPSLITTPSTALAAIVVADIWNWFPFVLLMVIAGLQMMPRSLTEAATMDGASWWQATWHVTLPHLSGVLLVAGLFRLIDSIKTFPLVYVLTEGGPGTVTEVTNYYSFVQAFNFSFLGYSSAITVVLVLLTGALSWLILSRVRAQGHSS